MRSCSWIVCALLLSLLFLQFTGCDQGDPTTNSFGKITRGGPSE